MSTVCSTVDDWVKHSDSRVQMAEITRICQHGPLIFERTWETEMSVTGWA